MAEKLFQNLHKYKSYEGLDFEADFVKTEMAYLDSFRSEINKSFSISDFGPESIPRTGKDDGNIYYKKG